MRWEGVVVVVDVLGWGDGEMECGEELGGG